MGHRAGGRAFAADKETPGGTDRSAGSVFAGASTCDSVFRLTPVRLLRRRCKHLRRRWRSAPAPSGKTYDIRRPWPTPSGLSTSFGVGGAISAIPSTSRPHRRRGGCGRTAVTVLVTALAPGANNRPARPGDSPDRAGSLHPMQVPGRPGRSLHPVQLSSLPILRSGPLLPSGANEPSARQAHRAHENARRNLWSGSAPLMQAPASPELRSVGPSGQDLQYRPRYDHRYPVIHEFREYRPRSTLPVHRPSTTRAARTAIAFVVASALRGRRVGPTIRQDRGKPILIPFADTRARWANSVIGPKIRAPTVHHRASRRHPPR